MATSKTKASWPAASRDDPSAQAAFEPQASGGTSGPLEVCHDLLGEYGRGTVLGEEQLRSFSPEWLAELIASGALRPVAGDRARESARPLPAEDAALAQGTEPPAQDYDQRARAGRAR